MGNDKVPILLYADDISLLSESEDDMQNMLDLVYEWYILGRKTCGGHNVYFILVKHR